MESGRIERLLLVLLAAVGSSCTASGAPHPGLGVLSPALQPGKDGARKRETDGGPDLPDSKRPRVVARLGWGQGLVRKKAPEKKLESPSSSMVTAVLIAALGSAKAVGPPTRDPETATAKSEDMPEPATERDAEAGDIANGHGAADGGQAASGGQNGSSKPEADPEEPGEPDREPAAKEPAPPPMSKEKLLLTIETTDSEIVKLEARLAELKEEEEALAQGDDNERPAVLPFPPDYTVDFVDLKGHASHMLYLQNTKSRTLAKRKQLLPRLMPPAVLERVAAGEALYHRPQDLESYHENIASHRKMRLSLIEIIMDRHEGVKRKRNKLHRQWHFLNQKYEAKQQRSSSRNSGKKSTPQGGSRVQARSALRSSSSLVTRSPRDTGVARSDADINEIIAQMEEEERTRHRIEFNLAKIPTMIIDPREREAKRFVSKNGLREDPVHDARVFSIMDSWNEEEKKQFFHKYMTFPKNFRKIAASLPSKNTQECVRFYYRYKKELDLKTKLKQHQLKKRGPGKKAAAAASAPKLEVGSILGKHERSDPLQTGGAWMQSAVPGQEHSAKKSKNKGWSEVDKTRFIRHIKAIGKDWKKLARAMGNNFSAAEVQAYYELSHESIEEILEKEAEARKEAEEKARAKKEAARAKKEAEARRQAEQQAMEQAKAQQMQQAAAVQAQSQVVAAAAPPVVNRVAIKSEAVVQEPPTAAVQAGEVKPGVVAAPQHGHVQQPVKAEPSLTDQPAAAPTNSAAAPPPDAVVAAAGSTGTGEQASKIVTGNAECKASLAETKLEQQTDTVVEIPEVPVDASAKGPSEAMQPVALDPAVQSNRCEREEMDNSGKQAAAVIEQAIAADVTKTEAQTVEEKEGSSQVANSGQGEASACAEPSSEEAAVPAVCVSTEPAAEPNTGKEEDLQADDNNRLETKATGEANPAVADPGPEAEAPVAPNASVGQVREVDGQVAPVTDTNTEPRELVEDSAKKISGAVEAVAEAETAAASEDACTDKDEDIAPDL